MTFLWKKIEPEWSEVNCIGKDQLVVLMLLHVMELLLPLNRWLLKRD
jgi:hypothetical protein